MKKFKDPFKPKMHKQPSRAPPRRSQMGDIVMPLIGLAVGLSVLNAVTK